MAKKTSYVPPPAQQDEEMVVTVVRFRGSGESLRKGIDALSQALAGAFGKAQVTTRQLNGRKAVAQVIAGETTDAEDAGTEDVDETLEPEVEEASPTSAKTKKPAAIKYSFLADFNLTPEGVPSLKEFCEPKNAETEQDRYLVVCQWLQTHGSADPFTGNQVFTCFRGLGWTPRKDVMQPVREMKSRRSWFDTPSYGKWRLTQPGVVAAEAVGQA